MIRTAILLLAVFSSAAIASAQDIPQAYTAILGEMNREFPDSPVILNNTIIKIECHRGGCGGEPWAGTFGRSGLEEIRSRDLIANFCVSFGECSDVDDSVDVSGGTLIMMSTIGEREDGAVEVIARLIRPDGPNSARQEYYRFTLRRESNCWIVSSTELIASGFIDYG